MKKIFSRILAIIMMVSLCFASTNIVYAEDSEVHLADKKIVQFGTYPQSEVTDQSLISILQGITPDDENDVVYNNEKYYKGSDGLFYKYEPIEWYVIDESNGYSTILSKKIITAKVIMD